MRVILPDVVAAAQASAHKWGGWASVNIAQWAKESGYGAHSPGNNPFGIKARPGEPQQMLMTREVVGGKNVRVPQPFRKFASLAAAFDAHGSLLAKGSAYARARATKSANDYALALQPRWPGDPAYATDPHYGESLIHDYMAPLNLYQYDQPTLASVPIVATHVDIPLEPVAPPETWGHWWRRFIWGTA